MVVACLCASALQTRQRINLRREAAMQLHLRRPACVPTPELACASSGSWEQWCCNGTWKTKRCSRSDFARMPLDRVREGT